jgi:hypothetical protein
MADMQTTPHTQGRMRLTEGRCRAPSLVVHDYPLGPLPDLCSTPGFRQVGQGNKGENPQGKTQAAQIRNGGMLAPPGMYIWLQHSVAVCLTHNRA